MTTTESTTTTPTHARPQDRVLRLIGLLGIVGGLVMILAGGAVWGTVSSQLRAENITVAEDASFLAGATVAGPFTAYAEADIISHHALEASGGKTYAELDREDPVRATVMNASFLRTSLFTSVVSFGVSAFVMGVGVLFILFGWSVRTLSPAAVKTVE